jgi:hypothetical protein
MLLLLTMLFAALPHALVAADAADLARSLVGSWDMTKIVMNKGAVELPPEPASLRLAADRTYRGKLGPGAEESGTWSLEEGAILRLKSADGPLDGKVAVAGEAMTLEVEGSVYHYRRAKAP